MFIGGETLDEEVPILGLLHCGQWVLWEVLLLWHESCVGSVPDTSTGVWGRQCHCSLPCLHHVVLPPASHGSHHLRQLSREIWVSFLLQCTHKTPEVLGLETSGFASGEWYVCTELLPSHKNLSCTCGKDVVESEGVWVLKYRLFGVHGCVLGYVGVGVMMLTCWHPVLHLPLPFTGQRVYLRVNTTCLTKHAENLTHMYIRTVCCKSYTLWCVVFVKCVLPRVWREHWFTRIAWYL